MFTQHDAVRSKMAEKLIAVIEKHSLMAWEEFYHSTRIRIIINLISKQFFNLHNNSLLPIKAFGDRKKKNDKIRKNSQFNYWLSWSV